MADNCEEILGWHFDHFFPPTWWSYGNLLLITLVAFCNFSSWPQYLSEVRLQLSLELGILYMDPGTYICQKSPYSKVTLWRKNHSLALISTPMASVGWRSFVWAVRLNSTPWSLRMKVVLTAVTGAETFLLIKNTTARCRWYDTICIVAHDVDDMKFQLLKHRWVNNLFCVDIVEIVTKNENSNNMCKS